MHDLAPVERNFDTRGSTGSSDSWIGTYKHGVTPVVFPGDVFPRLTGRSLGVGGPTRRHPVESIRPREVCAHPIVSITPVELLERLRRRDSLVVVDVRSASEFAIGHVPGAINIPFSQLGARADEVPGAAGGEVILYCGHGPRAWLAAVALRRRRPTRIAYLRGHWAAWREGGHPVEVSPARGRETD